MTSGQALAVAHDGPDKPDRPEHGLGAAAPCQAFNLLAMPCQAPPQTF